MEKYTLITGASSGIGKECAIQLSKARKLILSASNIEKLYTVKAQCHNRNEHLIWQFDFAKNRSEIFTSLSEFIKTHDVCVVEYIHFAGITQILPIKNFSIQFVDKIFNVNFFSIIEIIRALLKKQNKDALRNMLLISALFSIRGDIGNSIYAASKGAINSLVISLAQELSPVRVNSLLPGAILTAMSEKSNLDHLERLKQDTPLGFGSPQDVVNYVEFLLSDKASWITGQNIIIDGGRSTK